MNKTQNIRAVIFWWLDALKASPIKKELADISKSLALYSFEQLKANKKADLKQLLDTVVRDSKFYHGFKSFNDLEDFPVMNKNIIKENFEAINIPHLPKNLKKVSSSGSTGIPFAIYQTKRKTRRNKADVLYFANEAGYQVGDALYFVRLWLKKYQKNRILQKALNIIPVDIEQLDDKYLSLLINQLKASSSRKGFIGYASGFERLCKYLDRIASKPLNCNMQSIIATSESLPEHVREKMAFYFNYPVVSRYSNEEQGILAQQKQHKTEFTINWASFYIEILDLHEDKPAKLGDLGRIVVTDYYNFATPMIRYDTEDLGQFCHFENDGIPKLKTVIGRLKDVLYNTTGEIINTFVIYGGLLDFPEINDIQIIQKTQHHYLIKLAIHTEFKRVTELKALFQSLLGSDANTALEYVTHIEPFKSGKKRFIINEFKS